MNNKKLDRYLGLMEKNLGAISASEKAEIILEIKSHVLDALENSESTISEILASLGEPEQVANKYLLDRGLKPQKPSKRPIFKWLTIGFLGTFFLTLLFILILFFRFTPLVKINSNGIYLFNGIISLSSSSSNKKELNKIIKKRIKTKKLNLSDILVTTNNIKLNLSNSDDDIINIDCKYNGDAKIIQNSNFVLNFKNSEDAECNIIVPKNIKLKINAKNGKINFEDIENNIVTNLKNGKINFKDIQGNVSANLKNGKINFGPKTNTMYNYNLSIKKGKMDEFKSSNNPNAYKINLHVKNGKITK